MAPVAGLPRRVDRRLDRRRVVGLAVALGAEVAHGVEDLARHGGRVAQEPLLGRRDHAAAIGPAESRTSLACRRALARALAAAPAGCC